MEDFDIHDPDFAACPFPTLQKLRETDPVHASGRYGGFHLLTRYADVRAAALNWRRYTSSVVGVTAIPVITPRTKPQLPIEVDPPLHSAYRALVNPTFSAARIAELKPAVAALASTLLANMAESGRIEAVADYCMPLAIGTLGVFTGLPTPDAPLWRAWLDAMFDPRRPEKGKTASVEFGQYIRDLIAKRRRTPTGDFVSLLIGAEIDGRRLSDDEVHSFVTVMFGAGFETTADAMSGALHWLSQAPTRLAWLSAHPDQIALAAEEFFRFVSPVQIFGRNAAEDIEVHGAKIPVGRIVALGFGAANRDPEVFESPDECVLSRSPNRHVAFGAGPHLCLGAPVARLELTTTLSLLARFVTALSPVVGDPAVWKVRGDRRGLSRLPLRISRGDAEFGAIGD